MKSFLFLSFLLLPFATALHCDSDADCQNDGTCIVVGANDATHFSHSNERTENYCECKTGYSGPDCSVYCPLKCKNSGTCMYSPDVHAQEAETLFSDYYCDCKGDWKGRLCEVSFTQCTEGKKSQCLNGSTCKSDGSCDCSNTDFFGEVCEHSKSSKLTDSGKKEKEEVSTFGKILIPLIILGGAAILTMSVMHVRKKLKQDAMPPVTTPAIEKEEEDDDSDEGGKTVEII